MSSGAMNTMTSVSSMDSRSSPDSFLTKSLSSAMECLFNWHWEEYMIHLKSLAFLQGLWTALEGVFDTEEMLKLDPSSQRAMSANDKREKSLALLMSTIPPTAGRLICQEKLPSKSLAKLKAHFDTQTTAGKGSLLMSMFEVELSDKAPQEPELFDQAWTKITGLIDKINSSGLVGAQGKIDF